MKNKSLGMNAVLNGIRQCCTILFPLITFPYISRILGNDGYGKYSFSNSITSYFILLAALGIYTYAIREGAKIRDNQNLIQEFCSQVFSINVCSAIVSYFLLIIALLFSTKLSEYKIYILIQSSAIILSTFGTDWVNGIFEDYYYITIRYIIIQFLCLFAMFVFVKTSDDIIKYCIISVLATNGGNIINLVYVRRYVKIRFTFKINLKEHFIPLLILFANSIAILIYVNSDITMLGFFKNDMEVGIYSFASKIYNLLKQLINSIIVVSIPRISYVINNKPLEYKKYINKIFEAINLILLPIIVGTFFLSDSIIRIAGGEQYVTGSPVLKILSLATLFAIYSSLFTNCVLIVNRKEIYCLKSTIISALVNVLLNLILIPFIGMIGAALTTVLAELVNCFMQIYYSKSIFNWKNLKFKSFLSYICGTFMVGLICFFCNLLIHKDILKILNCLLLSIPTYIIILIYLKNQLVINVISLFKNKLK